MDLPLGVEEGEEAGILKKVIVIVCVSLIIQAYRLGAVQEA